jgi:prephenate dehydrogenase
MRTLAEQFCGFISPHTIVTDVGSVKRSVVAELSSLFAGNGCFIGSHPMAGSDQTGMRASRADLFHGATCIITPDAGVDLAALAKLRAFWVLLGARVLEMLPDEHDAAVALISHLPHAAAAALVQAVATTAPQALLIVGPGFRDTTRVASGPPEMWAEILRENRKPAVAGIDALIAKLSEIRSALHPERDESPEIAANKAEKVREFLASAKRTRDGIRFP